ncbi:prolyl oligopeptidase family serine peptidase [Kangiella sp. TOML190]|uniref:prolyl oligopeptidase family serine peptidase n=1 Tax=Kangiella sp. TOML190 TaxID=2931351 RepID=UPI00203EA085|nr:prolyl oligopeptidase family serine peptidase [Kangiella sp. TOML190]
MNLHQSSKAARLAVAASVLALGLFHPSAQASEQATTLTLEQVMADPDWIGNAPTNPYFSDDGQAIYYSQKIQGSPESQVWKLDLNTTQSSKVADKDSVTLDSGRGVINPAGTLKTFSSMGDIWVKYLSSGDLRQLTRTNDREVRPQFVGNNKVAYRVGHDFYAIDLNTGLIQQIADLELKKDPDEKKAEGYLETQQSRYFDYIQKQQKHAEIRKQSREDLLQAIEVDAPKSWYLGDKVDLHTLSLSPNGRYLLVGTYPKRKAKDKADNMPHFVTADGYVENEKVRALVGTVKPRNETLYLLDLSSGKKQTLSYDKLPMIKDDPLAEIKKKTAKRNKTEYKPRKGNRGLAVFDWIPNNGVSWADDSSKVAVMLYSDDNKDRWIAAIEPQNGTLKSWDHLRDEAWVNDWDFNDFGWLSDNQTLYFTSEKTGYSHLYLTQGKKAKALTKGAFIVNRVQESNDQKYLYYRANKKHPGVYEVYRVDLANNTSEAVTDLGGMNDYRLSNDGKKVVISHSTATRPVELFYKDLTADLASTKAQPLTNTISSQFSSIDWVQPEFIEVPSREADQPIYARLYKPQGFDANRAEKYPAVIFIHGAGYLQNAHQGWSGYFREFMFHTFLTRQGYVVLDMDFRASKGYGRDWRTAIYRQMGTPEVVDLMDGADWLANQANVERSKVGIYGGSYGGFLTFMALFTEPEAFAAGASLRPVTDWAHYNHGYTSNILNTPYIDPEAYEKSSPIEFAEGLNKPLLIAHGMVDDNVFFKDTVRLVQRLIELEKTQYFETAIYPIEPHGFTEPSSWLDEYKRIYYLFEEHLKGH